jgi:hypothetical protein
MTTEPGATPVTGTRIFEAEPPFGNSVTVGGTVATLVLLELRLTVSPPAGADAESVRVKFCVAVPTMVRLVGENVTDAVTFTDVLAAV